MSSMGHVESQNPKPKTHKSQDGHSLLTRLLFACLILVVVFCVWYIWARRALPRIAIAEIRKLTSASVDMNSVDFDFDGSVVVKQLIIRPERAEQHHGAILEAQTVYVRFSLGSLLLLKPRLKEIRANDFVFNTQFDSDTGRWNIAALKGDWAKGSGADEMPFITLKKGTLQYTKLSAGQATVIAAVPVDARLRPAEKILGGCSFDITTGQRAGSANSRLFGFWRPGRITVAGGLSSAEGAAVERGLTIEHLEVELNYEPDDSYALKLRAEDLRSTYSRAVDTLGLVEPVILQESGPFIALQKFLSQYRPAGQVDIDLKASGNFGRPGVAKMAGKVYCKDVSICDRKFPYLIEHLVGQADITQDSLLLNRLTGKHGDVNVSIDVWAKGFGPGREYEARVTSGNMRLDSDLYDALSTGQKKLWDAFSPSGRTAIDYRLSRRQQMPNKKTLAVKLLDVEATYRNFPYPLRDLTGRLVFDRESAQISQVVSRYDGRQIIIDGTVTERNTERPIYDISIKAENIPLDSTLAEALPVRQRNFYNQFDMTGLVDAEANVFTPNQDLGPTSFLAHVSPKNASLKLKKSPLLVSDISAKTLFTPDSISVEELTGLYGQGLVSLAGEIPLGDEGQLSHYNVTVRAEQVQLSDDLIGLLPAQLEKIASEWQLKGKINLAADLRKAGLHEDPQYEIIVDCLGGTASCKYFAYPLENLTGRLTIRDGVVRLEDITATAATDVPGAAEGSGIRANGEITFVDNAFYEGKFSLLASDIVLDKRLAAALPEDMAAIYRALSPSGQFDLDLTKITVFNAGDERYVDFTGAAKFKGSGLNILAAKGELDAELKTRGLYKVGEGLSRGRISVADGALTIKGKSITGLKADINYDPASKGWLAKDLIADCHGGRLIGKLEFKQPDERAFEYLLQVGFDHVDLKRFVKAGRSNETAGNGHTSGTMSGSLSIGARLGEGSWRTGRCRLAIKDMRVGKLSPLAKLLYVLRLTEPKDFAFERMAVDSYIKGDRLFFETFDLSGEAVAFYGSGSMHLPSDNVDLTLTARGQRLAATEPSLLQSLTEGLGLGVVRLEVTGNAYDPQVQTKALPLIGDTLEILGAPR